MEKTALANAGMGLVAVGLLLALVAATLHAVDVSVCSQASPDVYARLHCGEVMNGR